MVCPSAMRVSDSSVVGVVGVRVVVDAVLVAGLRGEPLDKIDLQGMREDICQIISFDSDRTTKIEWR